MQRMMATLPTPPPPHSHPPPPHSPPLPQRKEKNEVVEYLKLYTERQERRQRELDAREEERERRKEDQLDTLRSIFGELVTILEVEIVLIFGCGMNPRGLFYLRFGVNPRGLFYFRFRCQLCFLFLICV